MSSRAILRCFAALVWASSVLPAVAAESPPGAVECVLLKDWSAALVGTGQKPLAALPAPFTQAPTFYWVDPEGIVVSAPLATGVNGSGPCVAVGFARPLGRYAPGVAS